MDKITIERETLRQLHDEMETVEYDADPPRRVLALMEKLRAALAAQPAETVAWRWKERVNGMSDSDWTVTNVEPPDGVRVIAKEPLYAAQPAPAAVPPDERIRVLREALEVAKNGLGWWQESCPELVTECDHEAMAQIDAALEATK